MVQALRTGFLEAFTVWLEDVVSVVFLLLPKAIRQQVVQEWACILRQTVFPVGAEVPEYDRV
jgi:hypothetical protein